MVTTCFFNNAQQNYDSIKCYQVAVVPLTIVVTLQPELGQMVTKVVTLLKLLMLNCLKHQIKRRRIEGATNILVAPYLAFREALNSAWK